MSEDGPKIVELPPRDELKGAAEKLGRSVPELIRCVQVQAKVRRAAYLALLAEGFSEAQALDLCWRV